MTNRLLKFAGFAILACLSSVSAAQSYKHDISFALGVNSPDEGETKNIVPLIYKKYFKALSFSKGLTTALTLKT